MVPPAVGRKRISEPYLHSVWRALPYAGLLATTAVLVAVARQNHAMRSQIDELWRRANLPHPGAAVPTFRTTTLDGDSVVIGRGEPGHRQILFIYNTTCRFCRETLPAWSAIADQLSTSHIAVFGISLHPERQTRQYILEHGLSFATVLFPDAKLRDAYRAAGVPITMVVDHDGTVIYVRLGSIRDRSTIDSAIFAVTEPPSKTVTEPRSKQDRKSRTPSEEG